MPENYTGPEKREFFRYRHEKPASFKEILNDGRSASVMAGGITRNLSASGVLFNSRHLPRLSSIIALDVDYRTTRLCEEIEGHALVVKNKLVGKVVRIEDNDDGSYDIGVAFVKRSDSIPQDILAIIG